jgi:hypothetical protein
MSRAQMKEYIKKKNPKIIISTLVKNFILIYKNIKHIFFDLIVFVHFIKTNIISWYLIIEKIGKIIF